MNNITKYQTEADYTEDSANLEAPNVSVAKQEVLTHYKPIPTIVEVWNNGELTFRAEYPDGNIPDDCYEQGCDLLKVYGQVNTRINISSFRNRSKLNLVLTAKTLYLGNNVSYYSPIDGYLEYNNICISAVSPYYKSINNSLLSADGKQLFCLYNGEDIPQGVVRIEEFANALCSDTPTQITIPSTVQYLGERCFDSFRGCTIKCLAIIPPDISTTNVIGTHEPFHHTLYPKTPDNSGKLYVPDASLQLYKDTWPNVENLIFPISQLPS